MAERKRVVIVGGVAGGASAAAKHGNRVPGIKNPDSTPKTTPQLSNMRYFLLWKVAFFQGTMSLMLSGPRRRAMFR
jgi:hypothetical protein